MAMTIALAGLIFAGALIPVTATVAAHQKAEVDLQRATTHYLAAQRIERLTASIWRSDDPPSEDADLRKATSTRLAVGKWELRRIGAGRRAAGAARLVQHVAGQRPAPLAWPVQGFALRYRLNGGGWAGAVRPRDFDRLLAVGYAWTEGDGPHAYRGVALASDQMLADHVLRLRRPTEDEVRRGQGQARSAQPGPDETQRTIVPNVKDWQ